MAKLKAATRSKLAGSQFAGPGRSFPIPDKSHAEDALRERKFAANPAAIVAKVKAKFPGVGKSLLSSGMKKK
jgi:hypothetical protein